MHTQFLKYDLIIASMGLCFQTDSSISQDDFSLGWRKPILSFLIARFFSLQLSACWLLGIFKPEPYFSLLGNSMELPVAMKKCPLSLLSDARVQYITTRTSLRHTVHFHTFFSSPVFNRSIVRHKIWTPSVILVPKKQDLTISG